MQYEWLKYTDYVEYDWYDGPLAMSFKINGVLYYAMAVSDSDPEYFYRYFSVETTSKEIELYHKRITAKDYDIAKQEMFYKDGRYCVFDFSVECVRMEDLRLPVREDVI